MIRPFARLSPDAWQWWLVGLGVVLRLIHWVRDPVIWGDEAALVLNVLYLDFPDYFGRLMHYVPAPPLYLVGERLALLALGDSTLALRAPMVLVGCVSLFVFRSLARRVLDPGPAVLAIGLFAVSDRLIWHATEVKPYAVDIAFAVLVAWLYVHTRHWLLAWQCLLWAAVLPLGEWITYPGCFVSGGLMLALLPAAVRAGWGGRLAYLALGLAVVGSFAALALGPVRAQQDLAIANCWVNDLADWGRPERLPKWAVGGAIEIVEYALVPLGHLLLPVAVVGAARLGRRDSPLLTLLIAPIGLTLVAGLLGRYPFGGGRVSSFLVPGVILMIATGTPVVWAWLAARWRYAPIALAVVLAIPFGYAVYRIAVPIPRADFRSAVAYVDDAGRPDDAIVTGFWEVLYYTHGREDRVCPIPDIATRHPDRFWVLITADAATMAAIPGQVPPEWRLIESHAFTEVLVLLYERQPASSLPTGPPRSTDP